MNLKNTFINCHKAFKVLAVVLLFSSLSGCRKHNGATPAPGFTIAAISPAAGKFGTLATITGANFGSARVFFNSVPAEVVSATSTTLQVIVPKGAGPGYVTVQQNNEEVKGPIFTYEYTVTVSTVAGTGMDGYRDGNTTQALLFFPRGIGMDSHGNIFVADHGNNRIRMISPQGIVTTVAGNGNKGYKDGPALSAEFSALNGLAVDAGDNIYFADGSCIRQLGINNNVVRTVAGSADMGNVDGKGSQARFVLPFGVYANAGQLMVTDVGNNNVRMVDGAGVVTTLAGSSAGFADGLGKKAMFNMPGQLTVDSRDNIYVADGGNFRIRKMNAQGEVYTYAGSGNYGYTDGRFFKAAFIYPTGITADTAGNVYECGQENVIRKISPQGDVTTIAGNGVKGYADGAADQAMFNEPIYMFTAPDGSLYVADQSNNCIRRITIQ